MDASGSIIFNKITLLLLIIYDCTYRLEIKNAKKLTYRLQISNHLESVKLRSSDKLDSSELANSQEHGCFYETAFGGRMNPIINIILMIFIRFL